VRIKGLPNVLFTHKASEDISSREAKHWVSYQSLGRFEFGLLRRMLVSSRVTRVNSSGGFCLGGGFLGVIMGYIQPLGRSLTMRFFYWRETI